jgi:hypothetical protein
MVSNGYRQAPATFAASVNPMSLYLNDEVSRNSPSAKADCDMNRAIPTITSFSFEIVSFLALAFAVAFAPAGPHRNAISRPPSAPTGSPVIVELFTSEGCSSCPPADALLARYESQQPVSNAQIIALEEHVDYWDELGWVDPFSGREWTYRQADYATSLGNGNPYTPQMVIDGRTELVGSRESQARQVIARAASQPKTRVSVGFQAGEKAAAGTVQIVVDKLASSSPGDEPEVWLAITEADLHSEVTRGENAGRALGHASIVRSLRKVGRAQENAEVAFSQSSPVKLDSRWKVANLHAVAFVQERKSRRILGASIVSLKP